jgi:hypothetical protein
VSTLALWLPSTMPEAKSKAHLAIISRPLGVTDGRILREQFLGCGLGAVRVDPVAGKQRGCCEPQALLAAAQLGSSALDDLRRGSLRANGPTGPRGPRSYA